MRHGRRRIAGDENSLGQSPPFSPKLPDQDDVSRHRFSLCSALPCQWAIPTFLSADADLRTLARASGDRPPRPGAALSDVPSSNVSTLLQSLLGIRRWLARHKARPLSIPDAGGGIRWRQGFENDPGDPPFAANGLAFRLPRKPERSHACLATTTAVCSKRLPAATDYSPPLSFPAPGGARYPLGVRRPSQTS